jgi:hypothetical protein
MVQITFPVGRSIEAVTSQLRLLGIVGPAGLVAADTLEGLGILELIRGTVSERVGNYQRCVTDRHAPFVQISLHETNTVVEESRGLLLRES